MILCLPLIYVAFRRAYLLKCFLMPVEGIEENIIQTSFVVA